MNADFLKTNLHFKEGIKGAYYKKIDGFLYTVDPTEESEIFLYVNLPETNDEEKHAFIQFLKDNLKNFVKARIVKNGIKITLTPDAFKRKSFITNTAKMISEYFSQKGIVFENKKHPIDFKNNMYVFVVDSSEENSETAENAPEAEDAVEEIPQAEEASKENIEETTEAKEKPRRFKNFFSAFMKSQVMIIIIYLIFALIFFWLSKAQTSIAAICGYFMGWLPAEILIKRGNKNLKVFGLVTLFSLISLALSGAYVFLSEFLSQTQIYTASEFFLQSLTPSHCIFNVILGLLLSMFGTYSTLPARKKQKEEIDIDFE